VAKPKELAFDPQRVIGLPTQLGDALRRATRARGSLSSCPPHTYRNLRFRDAGPMGSGMGSVTGHESPERGGTWARGDLTQGGKYFNPTNNKMIGYPCNWGPFATRTFLCVSRPEGHRQPGLSGRNRKPGAEPGPGGRFLQHGRLCAATFGRPGLGGGLSRKETWAACPKAGAGSRRHGRGGKARGRVFS